MPVKSVPSYRLHKASGQARVIIDGRHVYLGKFNSPESRQNYARVVAEMSLASPLPEQASLHPPIALLLISEVLVKYLEFAEVYYGANETSSKEFRAMIDAVAPVNEMYGDSSANEFGPLKLKSIRQYMINQDLCRTEINKRIGRIKRVCQTDCLLSSFFWVHREATGVFERAILLYCSPKGQSKSARSLQLILP